MGRGPFFIRKSNLILLVDWVIKKHHFTTVCNFHLIFIPKGWNKTSLIKLLHALLISCFYFSLPKAYDVEARDREEKKRKQRDGDEVSLFYFNCKLLKHWYTKHNYLVVSCSFTRQFFLTVTVNLLNFQRCIVSNLVEFRSLSSPHPLLISFSNLYNKNSQLYN